ncbi:hypothetical protein [Nonomuraea rosea]|uniref:hypothetical protein n=1 Tax=Nonomuraea rosea TaxID=638574 RepID=UPI0031E8D767
MSRILLCCWNRVMVQVPAWLWRSGFVVPSLLAQARALRAGVGSDSRSATSSAASNSQQRRAAGRHRERR